MKKFLKRNKKMLLKMLVDAIVKTAGVACFFIGIGALAEMPTDPKQITQALAFFIFGVCILAYDSRKEDKRGQLR